MQERAATVLHAKYRGFCAVCHHTIWQNEKMSYDGQAKHLDCLRALNDGTPRVMDKRYERVLGKISKKKLRTLARERARQASLPS